jgi:hypothetical protein
MADQLQFRGGTTAQVNAATVVSRELIIDTSTDQIVSGPSKKKTVMEDANGDVEIGGDIDLGTVGTFSTTLQTVTPTANRTVSIPDATGTIGLVNGPTGSIQFNQAGALNGTSDFSTTLDWNNAATTFTGLKLNVTNTASAADSNLLDLQVGGTSTFKVENSGDIISAGAGLYLQDTTPLAAEMYYFGSNKSIYGIDSSGHHQFLVRSNNIPQFSIGRKSFTIEFLDSYQIGWSTLPGSGHPSGVSSLDTGLARDSAGVVKVTDGSTGTGYLKLIPTTVGALTAAATVGAGTKAFVTDSTSTLSSHHGQAVVGGGSNFVPVFSDGTNWIVG